jgi:hypothetical protein
MKSNKEIDKLKLIIYLIVLVAILGAYFNLPTYLTDQIIQWLVSMLVGSLSSLIAGTLVEALTGDLLKAITITITIKGFEFSITAFAIATLIVKFWLFGF